MSRAENIHARSTAYIQRAIWAHKNARKHRECLVQKVEKLLAQMEQEDSELSGLTDGIEEALVRSEFQGSKEQQLLQFAISSALSDPTIANGPQSARELPLGDYDPDGGENPALIADREEREAILRSALEREISALPELERQTLRGVYWEGKSQAEVAREQGVPTSTLNDAYKRAISKLARRLSYLRYLYTQNQ